MRLRPTNQHRLIYCANCSERNEMKVWVNAATGPEDAGFVCEKCGFFNPPEG